MSNPPPTRQTDPSFWGALATDRAAQLLFGACAAALFGALLAAFSPSVEAWLLRRHQGDDVWVHASLLPWPSMYSYVHHLHVRPIGAPTVASCPRELDLRHPHLPFGFLPDLVGLLDECGYEGATVDLVSEGRFTERTTRVHIAYDGSRWVLTW